MPLPFWKVEKVWLASDSLTQHSMFKITCTRCGHALLVKRSWHRVNGYGTAPCPYCFKTSRIPNQLRRKHG